MQHKTKATIGLALVTAFATTALAPVAAVASTEGKRNTAIGLTAATIYAASKGKSNTALVLGAGAAYAWKRTADSKKKPTYYYRSYKRGGHTYYYRQAVGSGACTHYNRGNHKGHAYGHYKYKKVYYRSHGRTYYRYVRC